MKKFRSIFVSVGIILAMTSEVMANSSYFYVKQVRVSDKSSVTHITPVSSVEVMNSSCSLTDYYTIDHTASSYDEMYATLMSAALSGKQVRVYVDPVACITTRQKVTVIEIKLQ